MKFFVFKRNSKRISRSRTFKKNFRIIRLFLHHEFCVNFVRKLFDQIPLFLVIFCFAILFIFLTFFFSHSRVKRGKIKNHLKRVKQYQSRNDSNSGLQFYSGKRCFPLVGEGIRKNVSSAKIRLFFSLPAWNDLIL